MLLVKGNLIDILNKRIRPAVITIEGEKIQSIQYLNEAPGPGNSYIVPGFVDSHVHIESSMLIPSEFARMAVVHGTVATVSDPHEIANVCGMEGVRYMIENGKSVPFKFNFGAPSCVPATIFETAGATLGLVEVEELLKNEDIKYLAEMMNFPGVLNQETTVMEKIAAAHRLGKTIDGHAPGLRGDDARRYCEALTPPPENTQSDRQGGPTDHECFTAAEALDKLQYGMKILIREGSAAKNFEALVDLLHDHYENMMFCSDDKHPDSLEAGHINLLCARAVAKGVDLFKVLRAACINPVLHYNLEVGLLREGDPADFIVLKNLVNFEVQQTFINGEMVAENGKTKIPSRPYPAINQFHCSPKKSEDFLVQATDEATIPVIEALDGQLITHKLMLPPKKEGQLFISDPERDILKIVVVNRYADAPVAKAFIKNTGLKTGALASSVAHDSHNLVAVGVDDESICEAINMLIEKKGGVSAFAAGHNMVVPLPVAGLMSNQDGYTVAAQYTAIDKMAKAEMGSTLSSPFMTLSFMALLVIPELKLSDKGLFDGKAFELIH